jgi:DNA-binding MarR family transcriptional regulator
MARKPSSTTTSPTVDALVQLSFAVQLVLTRVAAENDLSVTQLRLLGILRDRTPTMAAIADYLELDRSSVSGLIDRAERRGLVLRRPSEQDARVTFVALTGSGLAIGVRCASAVSAVLDALLSSTSGADRASIVNLAASIADRHESERRVLKLSTPS